jgi:F-type H+-transporting ATPase subunit delta
MSMNSSIGSAVLKPYVEALLSLAQSQNLTDRFGEETKALLDILNNSPDLEEYLNSPIVKAASKKAVLEKVGGDSIHPLMKNFLMILVDRNRILYLKGICQEYQATLRKIKGIVLAEVTSAVALSEQQTAAIIDKVKAMTGSDNVEIAATTSPEILGGVIIKVGSQLLDSSLRSQIRRIGMSISK